VTSSPDPSDPAASGRVAPPPLTVAVSLAALEAAVLVLYGLSLLPSLEGERLAMGASTVLFFAVYGGFLGYCATQLYRLRSWARPPLVLAQLMQILVGASFWGGSTSVIAVVAVVTAVLAIAGVFHPASIAAVEEGDRA
jgi:hypothetical protein